MRMIDTNEHARGAIFGAIGTAAMMVIVLMGFFAVAVSAGCSTRGSAINETASGEKKAKGPPTEIADVAGEESIRTKLAEATANGAAPEEVKLLRTQLENAREMNRQEAEKDLVVKNRLKGKQQKQAANEDFYASVKTWTGWATLALVLASVGLLVASFFVPTLPRRGAVIGLFASAGISMLRLALLKYGVLATDLMVYALFGVVVLGVVFVVVPLAIMFVRSRIHKVGLGMLEEAKADGTRAGPTPEQEVARKDFAAARAREATALLAVASNSVNEDRKWVASALQRVVRGDPIMSEVEALKSVGVKV